MQIRFAVFLFICLFAGLFALAGEQSTSAVTSVPTKMNFQGRVTNSSGNILANGTYNMRFRIFDAATAGTQQWSEDRLVSAGQGVTVTNGQFSVQLGSVTSLPASVFNSNSLYFEVELPTPASATTSSPVWTEGAMTPRNQLATSAYAFNSETLDGLDSAAFGQLDQNNTFTGNNTFNGTLQGGSSLTLGTTSVAGSLVISDGSSNTGTIAMAPSAGNYTYTIPVTTANDNFCLQTLANCSSGGGVSTVGSLDGTAANANGAAIVGSTLYLQSASTSNAGLVNTTTQSFAGNKTFTGTVSVSGTTALNDNVTVAANKTIQFVGGITSNRPSSPAEGTIYFDTDTDKLEVFSNGKWQADRADAVIVAASNSSQADKDAADYVADGNTGAAADGDQVQINAALTAGSGKKVVLLAGTYVADATILIPNNTTFTGVGQGTVIELADLDATVSLIENSDAVTGTGVVVQNLKLDGRSDLNTAGTQYGIYFDDMGSTSANRNGGRISSITSTRFRSATFSLHSTSYTVIKDNSVMSTSLGMELVGSSTQNNTISHNSMRSITNQGVLVTQAKYNVISSNVFDANTVAGISLFNTAEGNTVEGNTITGGNTGISGGSGSIKNTITNNTIRNTATSGISAGPTDNNHVISGNTVHDSGGTTDNNGLNINGTNHLVTGNMVTDTSATTTNYAINIPTSAAANIYLAANTLGTGSINDLGKGTIYANQVDASGNLITRNQGGASLGKTTAGTTLDIQGAIRNVALPTPTAPTLSTTGTAGSTTYGYRVAALDGLGETLASTETTIATGNATLTGANYINVTWPQVGGAVQYKVYRSTSGGTPATTGLIRTVAGNVLTTTDTGIAASGAVAASNTTGGASFGGAIQGSSSLTLGTASAQGSLVLNDGNGQTGTILMADTAGSYTYTIPVTTANDMFCLVTLANCSGVSTVGALDGGTANATGASIVGSTVYLQSASTSNAGLVNTTTQSFAGNKTFTGTVSVSGTTTLNDTVTIAADKTIKFVGGATGSRPVSPGDGALFFDTTTKQLLTFANGKWQADRSATTKVVAANNSSQAIKDAADYVADGTGDETEINAALTAAAGGIVYLSEGTYTAGATILVPNNTTLAGAGNNTLIQLADIDITDNLIENSDAGTGTAITLRDFRIDGQKTLNTAGGQYGIYLNNMGGGTGATARQGAHITNVAFNNFNTYGISLSSSSNGAIHHTSATGNSSAGYHLNNADRMILTGNKAHGNGIGFTMSTTDNGTFTGNLAESNTSQGFSVGNSASNAFTGNSTIGNSTGFYVSASTDNVFTGNTIQAPTSNGFNLTLGANNNQISSNRILNSGGTTTNSAIYIAANSDNNSVTSNQVTDSSATSNNYAINLAVNTVDATYLADNILGTGTINDLGTGTIYAGQVDSSGNLTLQPAANINLNKNTVVSAGTLTLGNASTAGSLAISDGSSNTGTIVMAPTAGNYTYTIPVTTANDTFCMVTLANCGGPGGGVTTVGTLDGGTANATGATIVGSTIYLQSASTSFAGLVNIGTQTFAGDKTFNGILTVGSASTFNSTLTVGTSTNGIVLSNTGLTLAGTARGTKRIMLTAEYAGAVLDAGSGANNTGSMTGGVNVTNRMNYYKWTTTQATNQNYDVVLQVPIPSDFDGWASTTPINLSTYTSNTTNGTVTFELRDSTNAVIHNFVSVTPTTTATWETRNPGTVTGTYTAGNYMTIRIRMQSPTSGDVRIGNLYMDYRSKF